MAQGVRLGARIRSLGFVGAAALAGCSSPSSDTPGDSGDPTAGHGCALVIKLSGGTNFASKASDGMVCTTSGEPPPGLYVTYEPQAASGVLDVGLSAADVTPGDVATGLATSIIVQEGSGSGAIISDCTADLLENKLLGSDDLGDRYLVRGTGSCLNMTGSTTTVDGSFSFATNAFWMK